MYIPRLHEEQAQAAGALNGWIAGLAVVGGALIAFGGASAASSSAPATWASVLEAGLGLLLLAAAVRQWRGRPEPDDQPTMPRWMQSIDGFSAIRAFGIAALLSGINPKNLALNAAGVVTITQAGLDPTSEWIAFGVFVLLASLSVAAPVAYYFIAGQRAEATLDSMKTWLVGNNEVVMGVLLLVFGVQLLAQGPQGLLG